VREFRIKTKEFRGVALQLKEQRGNMETRKHGNMESP